MSDTASLPPLPALPLPDGTLYDTARQVRGHPFLPPKVRAYALAYGQLCAEVTNALADRRVQSLRAGNTRLLATLMSVMNQVERVDPDVGALNEAMEVLTSAGMVNAEGELDWAALAARKQPAEPTT